MLDFDVPVRGHCGGCGRRRVGTKRDATGLCIGLRNYDGMATTAVIPANAEAQRATGSTTTGTTEDDEPTPKPFGGTTGQPCPHSPCTGRFSGWVAQEAFPPKCVAPRDVPLGWVHHHYSRAVDVTPLVSITGPPHR